jgi:hypothetical protein
LHGWYHPTFLPGIAVVVNDSVNREGGPSDFAQYLTYQPVVPYESSPLGGRSLSQILATAGSAAATVGTFADGHLVLLLLVPGGIIICGAASGVAEALQVGLRTKLLDLMGVAMPGEMGTRLDESEAPSAEAEDAAGFDAE